MSAPIAFTRIARSLMFVLTLLVFASVAHADTSSTRAARLTFVQGTVTVAEPNGGDSVPAQLNLPLLGGVQLVTGNDGQAEVEFEDGSIVRLTPNSVLSLDNLAIDPNGDFVTNLSLLRGLAYCELRATPQYRYFINVGGDILSPVENTTVRINFDESPAIFSVFDGTAEVDRQNAPANQGPNTGYQTQIRAGESLRADPANGNRYFLTQQIADDSWDQWNDDRDQAAEADAPDSTAVRNDYAGAEGYGWSDLDSNGNWYNVPGQGAVWQPQIAVDDSSFDPYGNGAWVYYPNSGYIWASGYSWGWTPYRCGNWSYYNGFGWGWAPGSGCGGRGWGFGGGGRPVNIVIGPTGYRPLRIPVSGSPHPRPILPVVTEKAWSRTGPARQDNRAPRQIGGVTAQPIARQQAGPVGTGSALRRDFPIDSRSKAPVLGLASTSPTAVHTTSGQRTGQPRQGPINARQSNQAPGQQQPYGGRYPSTVQSVPGNAASQPQGGRPAPAAPATGNPAANQSPALPAMNRYPANGRPADNAAPSQQPPNQNPTYRRPADNNPAPNQPVTNQNPSYRRPTDNNPAPSLPPANQPPAYRRPADNNPTPSQPQANQSPTYRRPADNTPAPNQPPPATQNQPRRQEQQPAPAPPRQSEPPPSYQRSAPQPTQPTQQQRPSPPPVERSAPPPSRAPEPSRPSSPPPSPPPAVHTTTEPAKSSPN